MTLSETTGLTERALRREKRSRLKVRIAVRIVPENPDKLFSSLWPGKKYRRKEGRHEPIFGVRKIHSLLIPALPHEALKRRARHLTLPGPGRCTSFRSAEYPVLDQDFLPAVLFLPFIPIRAIPHHLFNLLLPLAGIQE